MKISEWLVKSVPTLSEAGIESPRLDCLLLLENELKKPREWLLAHEDDELSASKELKLNKNLARRKDREPLAYIVGSKEFYGRDFYVNDAVLIPRPESEAIIELLKEVVNTELPYILSFPRRRESSSMLDPRIKSEDDKPRLPIIDIGTGSGCLAITAKLECPHATVVATDISDVALDVARKNAKILRADIEFRKSNLFSSISNLESSILLVNLPYVPQDLVTSVEITKEPKIALFSGNDGLTLYRQLWGQLSKLKNKPFCVITESLKQQHDSMQSLAKKSGYRLESVIDLVQKFRLI